MKKINCTETPSLYRFSKNVCGQYNKLFVATFVVHINVIPFSLDFLRIDNFLAFNNQTLRSEIECQIKLSE